MGRCDDLRRKIGKARAMRLRVLGCSGGIGGRHLRTTSFLVDSDILIDAGTGVGDLTLAELSQIDHIFVTHSHLDHEDRSEEHTSELQSLRHLVCRLLLEKKKKVTLSTHAKMWTRS